MNPIYAFKYCFGQTLSLNSVFFISERLTDKLLNRADIRREAPDRDNPFEMVPNLAGFNHLRNR